MARKGFLAHRTWLPVALFAAGVALILAAVAAGSATVNLLIVFPVITGSNPVFLIGVLLIVLSFFVGFALIMMGQLEAVYHEGDYPEDVERDIHGQAVPPEHQKKPSFGGLVLIGPIPIAFGSSRSIAIFMLVAGVVLIIAFIVAALLLV